MLPEKLIARYERKATRLPSGCLLYPKAIKAARRIYILRHGNILKGLFVCHTCDIPDCIEDSHHWLGTNKQNQEDAARKGRKQQSPEHKLKLRLAKLGRKLSEEHRKKISLSNARSHAKKREKLNAISR